MGKLARALAFLLTLLAAPARGEPAGSALDDTARFLARLGARPDSSLAPLTQAEPYPEHAEQIRAGWLRFEQPNLEQLRAWWGPYAPSKYRTVLYPFSGPDIANALSFFPNADTYLFFGLEAPGPIPALETMPPEAVFSGLNELRSALNTIFQVNYFITKGMEKKLGKGSISSITGLLLFFLAISDREILGAKTISLPTDSGRPPIPGVEISFRIRGGKEQRLRYFMVNVADAALSKSAPSFIPYLKQQGRFVTLIKSASYLLHKDGPQEPARFDQIRALILSQSDFLVQDDSGVPLRFFPRDQWKLRFHGRYESPTPEFAKHLQKDLRTEMQRNSTGRLPFSYGYRYKAGESNLMTAERVF
ncbi:MAG: hypothetical protein U1E65_22890 [Myxococcota bacterium]